MGICRSQLWQISMQVSIGPLASVICFLTPGNRKHLHFAIWYLGVLKSNGFAALHTPPKLISVQTESRYNYKIEIKITFLKYRIRF